MAEEYIRRFLEEEERPCGEATAVASHQAQHAPARRCHSPGSDDPCHDEEAEAEWEGEMEAAKPSPATYFTTQAQSRIGELLVARHVDGGLGTDPRLLDALCLTQSGTADACPFFSSTGRGPPCKERTGHPSC